MNTNIKRAIQQSFLREYPEEADWLLFVRKDEQHNLWAVGVLEDDAYGQPCTKSYYWCPGAGWLPEESILWS